MQPRLPNPASPSRLSHQFSRRRRRRRWLVCASLLARPAASRSSSSSPPSPRAAWPSTGRCQELAASGAVIMASSVAATELAREGLTLLLLHVPQHTVLGVDTQVFWVGPRFRGIKMVPPGPHLVHYCSPAGTGMSSHLQLDSFLLLTCLRWSFEDGIFKRRYSEAVKRFEFDDQLGPYTLDSFGDWKQFSSYLSRSFSELLEPIG